MATQRKTTRKLIGRAKDTCIADLQAMSLEEGRAIVSTIHVRNDLYPKARELRNGLKGRATSRTTAGGAATVASTGTAAPEQPPTVASPIAPPETAAIPTGAAETAAFDPFVFGLVPVFKREGEDGLRGRLQSISSADDLRAMAKSQQIILPKNIRRGEVDADVVRGAIIDAVAQRVSDRKAQM